MKMREPANVKEGILLVVTDKYFLGKFGDKIPKEVYVNTFFMLHTGRFLQQLLPPGHECDFQICLLVLICLVSDLH
jgi:hypothetical protein